MSILTYCAMAALMIAQIIVPATACAQNQASESWTPPRTVDGQPDMQGYWNRSRETGAAAYDIEEGSPSEESVINGTQVRPHPHVIVNAPIPYQPWALAQRDQNKKNSLNPTKLEHIDSMSRCLQMGMPRLGLSGGFHIIQPPGYVVIIYADGSFRTISLDGRAHIASSIKLWAGDSVGHWMGDTLVVDVTNINEHAYYDWAGNFHSDELHLTERWTLKDANKIDYEVTSDDPKVFTRPWTMVFGYNRSKEADPEQLESSCYENEHDVDVMLHHEKSSEAK
jgi:hypothetical protein